MKTSVIFLCLASTAFLLSPIEASLTEQTVLVFGDSLTAGYGLDDPALAYPGRLQARLDSERGEGTVRVIPAGLSGETTAGGLRRISWVLRPPRDWPRDEPFQLDVFILALGGNDGLRGIDVLDTRNNLQGIVDKVKAKYPDVKILIAGMEMPVNLGEEYRAAFRESYQLVAEANEAVLIPFFMEGVGGLPEFMLPDQIHPNPKGHQKMADKVYRYLEPCLDGRGHLEGRG